MTHLLETLLVQEVADEPRGAAQDKEGVQTPNIDVLIGLGGRESTALAQQIDKADCNAPVHVQNQVGLLRGGQRLHLQGKVQQWCGREVFVYKVLPQEKQTIVSFQFMPTHVPLSFFISLLLCHALPLPCVFFFF